jgi:hypothetical protein
MNAPHRPTGAIYGLSSADYHGDKLAPRPSLSSTLARKLFLSPLHAWTASPRLNPDWQPEEKAEFDLGRAAHRAVLGRGDDYAAIPEELLAKNGYASTKAAKKWIEEQRAAGVTPLSAEAMAMVETMAAKCRERLALVGIKLNPERSELAAIGERDDCAIRCMADNAPRNSPWLIDFKTARDASPDGAIRAVTTLGYDLQAAHYEDTWEAATGERRRMLFIFQEKTPPFEVGIYELHQGDDEADWMTNARDKAKQARRIWADCLRRNDWPGFPAAIGVLGAPGYYSAKWEGRAKPPHELLAEAHAWQAPTGEAA